MATMVQILLLLVVLPLRFNHRESYLPAVVVADGIKPEQAIVEKMAALVAVVLLVVLPEEPEAQETRLIHLHRKAVTAEVEMRVLLLVVVEVLLLLVLTHLELLAVTAVTVQLPL